MGKIQVLDGETINKIAAGEVVERPSSVVKELVENAIDAGATAITAEIQDGGTAFIRITDNGGGMEKEDISMAFYAIPQAKIRKADDLQTIASLGFRERLCQAFLPYLRWNCSQKLPMPCWDAAIGLPAASKHRWKISDAPTEQPSSSVSSFTIPRPAGNF